MCPRLGAERDDAFQGEMVRCDEVPGSGAGWRAPMLLATPRVARNGLAGDAPAAAGEAGKEPFAEEVRGEKHALDNGKGKLHE